MYRATVLRPFKDKYTGVRYYEGQEYQHEDRGRMEYLAELGYIDFRGETVEASQPQRKRRKVKGEVVETAALESPGE